MTPTAKRFITLDNQYQSNDKKAEKYESGFQKKGKYFNEKTTRACTKRKRYV